MADTSAPLSPPATIGGRYDLRESVGRGGMATVYRAHDRVLDRPVAVKVLHEAYAADPAFLEHFRSEAKAAAGLSHARVVAVHDWGEEDAGAYMVMEFIDGRSLRDVLQAQGRLSPPEALALLGPASAGVAAAHTRGLVHGDVKPENILIGSDHTVKVADFGVARAYGAGAEPARDGPVVASPHYVAPEIVRGEDVGPPADVYALGVMLYELLCGQPPFQGDTPQETARLHTKRTVPPPSRTVRDLAPELDTVVTTATAADPADRYRDATAFATALRAAVPAGPAAVDLRNGATDTVILPAEATETVVTGDTAPSGRSWWRRPWRLPRRAPRGGTPRGRRRAWLIALAAVVVAAVASLVVWDQVVAPMTPVPAVTGDPQQQAIASLEAAGFTATLADREHSLEVPVGHVLVQSPADSARRGSAVRLTVSQGPREHPVPALAGEQEAAAVSQLEELQIQPEVVRSYDETVPEGVVIGTDPAEGSQAAEGSTVRVEVSRGRQPLNVPGVVGRPADEATAELANRGFTVSVAERRFDPDVAEGAVIAQRPPAGETLFRGDEVELVVSRGPKPFALPDLRGASETDARATLRERGVEVEVEYIDTVFPWREGEVDASDPPPEAQVRAGDTVTLYVWE